MPSATVRQSESMTEAQRGNTEKTTDTLVLEHGYTSTQPSFVGFPLGSWLHGSKPALLQSKIILTTVQTTFQTSCVSTLAGRHTKNGSRHLLYFLYSLFFSSFCKVSFKLKLLTVFFLSHNLEAVFWNTWYPSTVFPLHSPFLSFFTYPSGWESRFLPGLSLEWGNPHPLPPYPPPSFSSSLVSFHCICPSSKMDSCTSHTKFSWRD